MLQEYFLRRALAEIGVHPSSNELQIDHVSGINRVYGVTLGLKYPREYLAKADTLPIQRRFKYAFSGSMQPSGKRKEMLAPFMQQNSRIEEDNYGRNISTKYRFNTDYYALIRSCYFSLCPHQADWTGPVETMWTYRFIESTFAKALPIVFRLAPCGEPFLRGFHYFWDDEEHSLDNYEEKLMVNRLLAEERFFLTAEEIAKLKGKGVD
jgi:hypothetical protein